ncbi:unnamed protein product [Adineta ricciae]|nr:unnamed protein product [Adineta ricciae]
MEVPFKKSPYFYSLPLDAQKYLVHHNIYATSSLKALYLTRQADLWNNEDFQISYIELYNESTLKRTAAMSQRLDPNGLYVKIMLYIIAFSSNYSIVNYNALENSSDSSNLKRLTSVQDICASLLWKYLTYQYSFQESVIRYSSLIKILLDILSILEYKINIHEFNKMMNNIVEQTEQSFVLSK